MFDWASNYLKWNTHEIMFDAKKKENETCIPKWCVHLQKSVRLCVKNGRKECVENNNILKIL